MNIEVEAKFLSVDKNLIRSKLKQVGFVLEMAEHTMRRKTFDFSHVAPNANKWGRVRQEANRITMSVKEVRGSGIDGTYEIELTVDSFEKASAFFQACNIPEKSFQENKREVWKSGAVTVTIDTWPGLDAFVEVEADDEREVREAARKLGFDFSRAVFGSIDLIYERELGIPAAELIRFPRITFDEPPTRQGAPTRA